MKKRLGDQQHINKITGIGLSLYLACLAPNLLAEEIDYSEPDHPIIGQALYAELQGAPLEAMAMLIHANNEQRLGNDAHIGQSYLADKLAEHGMGNEAIVIYKEIATTSPEQNIRDDAWLQIAMLQHDAGQHEDAFKTLANIKKTLNDEQSSNYSMIKAHSLLEVDAINQALYALPPAKECSEWALFQLYNFGVKLLNEHGNKQGAAILNEISNVKARSGKTLEALAALKDQANLALGFSLLQINNPAKARDYLQRINLKSPASNMALLGLGWSYAIDNDFENALVYWFELQTRPVSSTYTYESLLAIPYALSQAEAYAQAASYYKLAINRFNADATAIKSFKATIDETFTTLISGSPESETAWLSNWDPKAGTAETLLVPLLLNNSEFQYALSEYRSLMKLKNQLDIMTHEIGKLEHHPNSKYAQLFNRHNEIEAATNNSIHEQKLLIQKLAIEILNAQQEQIDNYLKQANFGAAQLTEYASLMMESE